ncbi:MAG: glucose-6-phosphate isomerase [Thermoprotei archaeon]|nr:MAG: glucose-6-phosphate isomerase [Thermoprotei archaeon]
MENEIFFKDGKLEFFGRIFEPQIRWLNDLKKVLANPQEVKENEPAYFMFRDLFKNPEEKERIEKNELRFDITVIPPRKIGNEFIKTFGHYHSFANGLTYPEVYQVLEGEAYYLLQKVKDEKEVEDVICVKAKENDIVLILPNYGHVTINPTNKTLIMANWVYRNFKSIYEPFEKMRGACYYCLESGWIKNPNYEKIPELRSEKPNEWLKEFGLEKKFMYEWVKEIEKLEFLKNPSKIFKL